MKVPWTERRSAKSIIKEINPEYSLEGLMLKLKLQYFGHLMKRTDSLEKTLMLGKLKVGGGLGTRVHQWCLLISWLQSPSAVILEPPKIKSDTVSTVSPSISHEVMGPDAMILVF